MGDYEEDPEMTSNVVGAISIALGNSVSVGIRVCKLRPRESRLRGRLKSVSVPVRRESVDEGDMDDDEVGLLRRGPNRIVNREQKVPSLPRFR